MRLAGCMDSTWCTSFGQLSKPYSRASACCAAARFTDGSAARSASRCSLACLRSCSSDGRSGRCRRGGTDMTISFRISPASARRAERRSQIVTSLRQVGSALPADGMRPVTRVDSTHDSTDGANARILWHPGPVDPRRDLAGDQKDRAPRIILPKRSAARDIEAVLPVCYGARELPLAPRGCVSLPGTRLSPRAANLCRRTTKSQRFDLRSGWVISVV